MEGVLALGENKNKNKRIRGGKRERDGLPPSVKKITQKGVPTVNEEKKLGQKGRNAGRKVTKILVWQKKERKKSSARERVGTSTGN